MNTESGHVVSSQLLDELFKQGRGSGYEPVPPRLEGAAHELLAGGDEAHVSKHDARSPLGRWAADRRKARRQAEKHARYLERKRRKQGKRRIPGPPDPPRPANDHPVA